MMSLEEFAEEIFKGIAEKVDGFPEKVFVIF